MTSEIQIKEQGAAPGERSLQEQESLDQKLALVEIERTQFRFRSRIEVSDGKAILLKPEGLKPWPNGATHVRVRLPGLAAGQMRLEVIAPHVELGERRYALVCAMPGSMVKNLRIADRFSTANRPALVLEVAGHAFPVDNVSATGCRVVLVRPEQAHSLPLREVVPGGILKLGPDFRVRFAVVTPRNQHGRRIGCEFRTARDEVSLGNLSALLDSLKRQPLASMDEPRSAHPAG